MREELEIALALLGTLIGMVSLDFRDPLHDDGELSSLVELAAEGLGVAVLPRSATDGADVAVVELTRPRLQRRTALAWNETATSPAGHAFLALADQRFAEASAPSC